jgi:hypothetical protein
MANGRMCCEEDKGIRTSESDARVSGATHPQHMSNPFPCCLSGLRSPVTQQQSQLQVSWSPVALWEQDAGLRPKDYPGCRNLSLRWVHKCPMAHPNPFLRTPCLIFQAYSSQATDHPGLSFATERSPSLDINSPAQCLKLCQRGGLPTVLSATAPGLLCCRSLTGRDDCPKICSEFPPLPSFGQRAFPGAHGGS